MIKRLLWLICLGSLAYATTPTISNIQLNDKPYIEGDISTISPKISATVLDIDHGVATWNIKIYRADTDGLKGTGSGNGGNTTSELAISFERSLENRAHYAIIDVTDAAGNTATTRIPTFNIVSTFQLNNIFSAPNPFNPHQTKAQTVYRIGTAYAVIPKTLVVAYQIDKQNNRSDITNIGLEFWADQYVAIRAGDRDGEVTFGPGLRLAPWAFDISWTNGTLDDIDNVYRFSLGYQFNAPKLAKNWSPWGLIDSPHTL